MYVYSYWVMSGDQPSQGAQEIGCQRARVGAVPESVGPRREEGFCAGLVP